jgi:hypothetical protein
MIVKDGSFFEVGFDLALVRCRELHGVSLKLQLALSPISSKRAKIS